MSSCHDRRDPPDELDRLVSAALHDMVRAAEPPPRVWRQIRAAVMADQDQPVARRWRLSRWPGWTAIGRLLSWLGPVQPSPTWGFMTQAVQFADVGDVPPRLVWWLDVKTRPCGPDGQTWMITT
jgi:hypothetical protein